MPTFDDMIAHFNDLAKNIERTAKGLQKPEAVNNLYGQIVAYEQAALYLSTQRANFMGEFDRIKDEANEELLKVTEERDRLIQNARDPGQVRPLDYEYMKVSSAKAWPGAIRKVQQRDAYRTIQAKHDQIMQEWVEQRGDGLLPNDYDFLVYSHGVVWGKVLEESIPGEVLQSVREKYVEYMELVMPTD